jgi:CRISPR-associated endonuclease Cas2
MDQRYLLLYDISSNKTNYRLNKALDQYNKERIQKSLFELILEESEYKRIIHEISEIIDWETDKVLLIPLCEEDWGKAQRYGSNIKLPETFPSHFIL